MITVGELYNILYDCSIEIITYFNTQRIVIRSEYDDIEDFPEDLQFIEVEKCLIKNGAIHGNDPCAIIKVSWEELEKIGARIVNNEITFSPYSVYVIKTAIYGYDEYNEITVIAKNEKNAKIMIEEFFNKTQFPLEVKHICTCDAQREQVLTISYVPVKRE